MLNTPLRDDPSSSRSPSLSVAVVPIGSARPAILTSREAPVTAIRIAPCRASKAAPKGPISMAAAFAALPTSALAAASANWSIAPLLVSP
jgi:hypothetical protein